MSYYVLADCNNFYVSCEKLFQPSLEGKAVIVLSQNDGCIISRSQEAKQFGLKMGEPYFKVKEFCRKHSVIVISSNYRFYGDISARVMQLLTQLAPEIEVSSIDEAFMKFPMIGAEQAILTECRGIREKVRKWIGIPISIGIAPTKTLAKLANNIVKMKRELGVVSLLDRGSREEVLKEYPVEWVWGIGPRSGLKLRSRGIFTAWEFSQLDPDFVKKFMGVIGEKLLWELRGVAARTIDPPAPQKSITFARSFGSCIKNISELSEALATFASKACVKLRKQNSCASALQIYLETISDGFYSSHYGMIMPFPIPTNDTSQVISVAKSCLNSLYDSMKTYRKCGIFLLDLVPADEIAPDLFLGGIDTQRRSLMDAVDELNERFGKNTVFFGAAGVNERWASRSQWRKEYSTTSWDHLPIVHARGSAL